MKEVGLQIFFYRIPREIPYKEHPWTYILCGKMNVKMFDFSAKFLFRPPPSARSTVRRADVVVRHGIDAHISLPLWRKSAHRFPHETQRTWLYMWNRAHVKNQIRPFVRGARIFRSVARAASRSSPRCAAPGRAALTSYFQHSATLPAIAVTLDSHIESLN